jgi:hypothetical protein
MEIKNYPEIMKADKIVGKINYKWTKTMARLERIPKGTAKNKKLDAQCDEFYKQVKTFNNTIYAKVVFDTFAPLKPMLVAILDGGKIATWDEVFGDCFDQIPYEDRIDLTLLVIGGGGAYRFTEDVIWPNGEIVGSDGRNSYGN